jgi:glycosyltransferase involved in cell wall biosynthesis
MLNHLDNLDRTLGKCSNLPIEIILIHDDANDGTENQLQALMKKVQGVDLKFKRVSLGSPGLARNEGLNLVTTEWVCFWDSDDLPEPAFYLSMIELAQKKDAKVAIGNISTVPYETLDSKSNEEILSNCTENGFALANLPGFTRMAFHVDVIGNNRFNAFRMGEDQCFLRDLDFLNFETYLFPSVIYRYVTNFPSQLTRNQEALKDIRKTFLYLSSIYPQTQGKMKDFAFGQLLKVLLGVIRRGGAIWFLFHSHQAIRTAFIFLSHPIKLVRLGHLLTISRAKLAGR